MDNTNTTHGRFITHLQLASLWAQYNGQRGTETQCLRIMRQLTLADLVRMLGERGVDYSAIYTLDTNLVVS